MAIQAVSMVVPHLQTLFDGGPVAGLSDAQLIDRFLARRDRVGEAAFSVLVERHGPMVLGLCRRLVGDAHLAEDAFQAVFLILARKAPSLHNPDLLGNWLYGVTIRTARDARRRRTGRRALSVGAVSSTDHEGDDPTVESLITRESAEVLHAEIDRLPHAFRLPIVLCYFEGLSLDDAAARLEWPQGTLRSRLARARDKLRIRLERRGVALSTAVLATILGSRAASAAVPSSLCAITARAAMGPLAEGVVSASVAALAQQVLRAGMIGRIQTVAKFLVVLSAVGGAGYFVGGSALSGRQDDLKPSAAIKPDEDVDAKQTVVGRVVDPEGKPVAGAFVDVVGRPRFTSVTHEDDAVLGSAVTGSDGRYRIQTTAPSQLFDDFHFHVLAAKPGFGFDWAFLMLDSAEVSVDLALSPEKPVNGLLLDFEGRPVAGAPIRIQSAAKSNRNDMDLHIKTTSTFPRAWPRLETTDAEGRFVVRGLGKRTTVGLDATDERYPYTSSKLTLNDQDEPAEVSLKFPEIAVVDGRVLAHDTGLPLPLTVVLVWSFGKPGDPNVGGAKVETDEQGRFKTIVRAGYRFRLYAKPAPDQPYFAATRGDFASQKLQTRLTKEMRLVRGVVIHGRVVEAGTGKRLENATVRYLPSQAAAGALTGSESRVATAPDGTYRIVVPAGKGRLFIHGPTFDYVAESVEPKYPGDPDGTLYHANRILSYDVGYGDAPVEINAELRRGNIARGRVVGPEGAPVDGKTFVALLQYQSHDLINEGLQTSTLRDGRFELFGIEPTKPARVIFLDAAHKWGGLVDMSSRLEDDELTIRLQPCGEAEAVFVDPQGKPLVRYSPYLTLIVPPLLDDAARQGVSIKKDARNGMYVGRIDQKNYRPSRVWLTDDDGRIVIPALVPGAVYRISRASKFDSPKVAAEMGIEFSAKPGETLDLGKLLVPTLPRAAH